MRKMARKNWVEESQSSKRVGAKLPAGLAPTFLEDCDSSTNECEGGSPHTH